MNKTRRRRVTTSDNTAGASVFELYEIHGDAKAALAAGATTRRGPATSQKGSQQQRQQSSQQQQQLTAEDYNRVLLSYMASEADRSGSSSNSSSSSKTKILKEMEVWEKRWVDKEASPGLKARKRTRNEWIAAYNRALILLANGDVMQSNHVCSEKLRTMVTSKKKASSEMSMVSTRMAFLFLEGILANSLASHSGLRDFEGGLEAKAVMEWLDIQEPQSDPQFKFLLSLYKSRSDFAQRDEAARHLRPKLQSARKELKQAMDIFSNKLRPSNSGEESLASSLEADSEVHNTSSTSSQQQNPPMSLVLQKQNQAALNLKANVEHLKGNPKKSLILLGEALAATPNDPCYDAMHANNLALVYQSNMKRHLAMHAISKALRVDLRKPYFQSDGTARPDPSLVLLYNSALCSLQARKFLSAYECMSACVKHSRVFCRRPRCWLLLAEACLGLHAANKKGCSSTSFSTVEVKGEAKGLVIQNMCNAGIGELKDEPVRSSEANGADDLEQVKAAPLDKARICLETSLYLLLQEDESTVDKNALASTRLALSYVLLEKRDFVRALKLAQLVIDDGSRETNASDASSTSTTKRENTKQNRLHARKVATARMYASEASCALGDGPSGMRFLVGDGQDDAFDRLSSDLGGVTIEVAATNVEGKTRLARAQSMVRSSASAASAVLGNIGPAKQLAMSAQAMEDACSSSREGSTARRALVYCMLREGNCGAALSLLKSFT